MHRNDASRSAVTTTLKAVQTVSSRPQKASGAQPREREQHLRALADKLLFTVEKNGSGFTLSRLLTFHARCGARE